MTPAERLELADTLARLAGFLRRLAATGTQNLTTISTLNTLATVGECRLTELAAREGLTQPAMTQLVSRLVANGLVERQTGQDRRVVNVRLTTRGRELVAERWADWDERIAEALGGLAADDQSAIAGALPAIRRLLA